MSNTRHDKIVRHLLALEAAISVWKDNVMTDPYSIIIRLGLTADCIRDIMEASNDATR